ncbi:MAG: RNA 2',3'-cyclic phosphodiesterase [Defluviitaleaceae bacterium]|nr:RNA 2',3'-cyclic phosphodiesterase [Defluviitaleaceae bacterium]
MELFVAIVPNQKTASCLADAAAMISKRDRNICPTTMSDLHLTLCYLGETEDVKSVISRLAAVEFSPFSLAANGIGTFQTSTDNVIWAGVEGDLGQLHGLKLEVDKALGCAGADELEFSPHITLGSSQSPISSEKHIGSVSRQESFEVDRFFLFQVLPEKSASQFEIIAEFLPNGSKQRVNILCVNDFHAAILESEGGLGASKLTAAIKDYVDKNPDTIVVFGGDNYFGDPMSELLEGEPVSHMMREMGTVASVMGNHDFDFGAGQINLWQGQGGFQFLGANVQSRETGELAPFVKPYVIVPCGGLNIALIGLATQDDPTADERQEDLKEYAITDGTAAARCWINHLKAGPEPDVIIALTHYGLQYDKSKQLLGDELLDLCKKLPELDGVFAAHRHQFMREFINGVPVAQGGSMGRGFSLLRLYLDQNRKVSHVVPDYIDLMPNRLKLTEDRTVKAIIEKSIRRAESRMGEVIAVAEAPIPHREPATGAINPAGTPLSFLATEAVTESTGIPVVLLYAGRMGEGFPSGPVTLYQYYRTMFFANGIVTEELPGSALLNNLETGLRTLAGEGASPLAVGGLQITADMKRPWGKRLLHAALNDGSPIEPGKYYPVAMDSYLATSPIGFDFSSGRNRQYLNSDVRELLLEHLRRLGRLMGHYPENVTVVD